MKCFAKIRRYVRRVQGICGFARTASGPWDFLKLVMVGYARGHPFSANDFASRVLRHWFPEIKIRPKVLGGLSLAIDPANLSHLAVLDEILIQGVYDLQRVPFIPDLILDCGAYVGMFALLAASKFRHSKLIAFEPDPRNCEWLHRQVRDNALPADVIQAAVFSSDGQVSFEAGRECGSTVTNDTLESSNSIQVKAVDLAKYILPTGKLLLKIDIEGAEEQVLPHIVDVLPADTFVFFETHGGQDSWERLSGLLRNRGFVTAQTRSRDVYIDGTAVRTAGATCLANQTGAIEGSFGH